MDIEKAADLADVALRNRINIKVFQLLQDNPSEVFRIEDISKKLGAKNSSVKYELWSLCNDKKIERFHPATTKTCFYGTHQAIATLKKTVEELTTQRKRPS